MAPVSKIDIEVTYARADRQVVVALEVEEGCDVATAISRSGLLQAFPEIVLERGVVGVFGRIVPLDEPLEPGDRVEIYRPLQLSPREARRLRAARAGKQGARK